MQNLRQPLITHKAEPLKPNCALFKHYKMFMIKQAIKKQEGTTRNDDISMIPSRHIKRSSECRMYDLVSNKPKSDSPNSTAGVVACAAAARKGSGSIRLKKVRRGLANSFTINFHLKN